MVTLVWSQFRDTVENVTEGGAAGVSQYCGSVPFLAGNKPAGQPWGGGVSKDCLKGMRAGVCGARVFVRTLNGDEGLIVAYPGEAKEIDCDA